MRRRFSAALAGLFFLTLAQTGHAEEIPLRLSHALVLRAGQPENDLNLQAYGQVFDSVALGWKTAPAAAFEQDAAPGEAGLILVAPSATALALTPAQVSRVADLVERGATLVTEGISPLSERLGFRSAGGTEVRRLEEAAWPDVMILWERPATVPMVEPPAGASVLTREKWSGAPMVVVLPFGRGHCLLLASELDPVRGEGYGRYPYFLHALRRAGVVFPFRSERLAAFFDYGYRVRVDLEYFARKWRRAGIQVLHAGAWHFYESDPERDAYLRRLIAACHHNGILVYAWLELPHVSEAFYEHHPQWREKTALGQDAHFDWRLPVNLKDPECFREVTRGLRRLLGAFDWDGVNLAEIYFEAPFGPEAPVYYTPFNSTVRAEFQARHGVDPRDFFRANSPHYWKKDAGNWAKFVDYRVEQVRLLNERLLRFLTRLRGAAGRTAGTPKRLGLVLTYVDNLYDPKMREGVGVDIKEMLPLLDRYDFVLALEDPFTVWHLGPRRYSEMAASYARLTPRTERLGMDINIVDREEAYPTDKQTGVEFLQLFHHAGKHFPTVLAYAEQSIMDQDLELVAHALAAGVTAEVSGNGVVVKSGRPVVYRTGAGPADFRVDGNPWPCVAGDDVLLPAGEHRVTAAPLKGHAGPRLLRLNGDLLEARSVSDSVIEFAYRADARAIALFDRSPAAVRVDGAPVAGAGRAGVFLLPPGGPHRVRAVFRPGRSARARDTPRKEDL